MAIRSVTRRTGGRAGAIIFNDHANIPSLPHTCADTCMGVRLVATTAGTVKITINGNEEDYYVPSAVPEVIAGEIESIGSGGTAVFPAGGMIELRFETGRGV